jgi:hypothetical protein
MRTPSRAIAILLVAICASARAGDVRKLVFDGVICERKIDLKDLGPDFALDWSGDSYLVMEMRTSSPHRFALWIYTDDGPRKITFQPFGQNAWMRACIPLQWFEGMDHQGTDLASAYNRRSATFWAMVGGPFGELKSVRGIGFQMDYPIDRPTLELRNIHLATTDEGSKFLEPGPVVDEFGQWALADWPEKIKSRNQLALELAAEAKSWGSAADFGYDKFNGYADTQAPATGFFRVEQIDGKWWFIDPLGHLFLSTGINGTGAGFGARPARVATTQAINAAGMARINRRLESWGMTTGGFGRPVTEFLYWPLDRQTTFLGIPDVYSVSFADRIDAAAKQQCLPRKDDPMILGYFVGNEPPWGDREDEVVKMILAGPDTATKAKLQEFLTQGDTPARRRKFVSDAFKKYLELTCAATKKYDPNHLILGIRFGGNPTDEMLRLGSAFDVCSINIYEYEPTRQIHRAYRLTGRPVLIGEFHIGVPANGLGAGLVQAMDQSERANGYRYYVEQSASLDEFLGAYWFEWRDEPVLGRFDGENYNIGFIDATDRPYPEMVEAAKATNKVLKDVHLGNVEPFNQRPMASEVGSPATPWD